MSDLLYEFEYQGNMYRQYSDQYTVTDNTGHEQVTNMFKFFTALQLRDIFHENCQTKLDKFLSEHPNWEADYTPVGYGVYEEIVTETGFKLGYVWLGAKDIPELMAAIGKHVAHVGKGEIKTNTDNWRQRKNMPTPHYAISTLERIVQQRAHIETTTRHHCRACDADLGDAATPPNTMRHEHDCPYFAAELAIEQRILRLDAR